MTVAVVLSGFPRVSETFAINELRALARRGLLACIVATKPGDGLRDQPGVEDLMPFVHRLEPGTDDARAAALAAIVRRVGATGVHAYFAHEPAAIAAAAAKIADLPFGFSSHARDARKAAPAALAARIAQARVVVCCNDDVARDLRAAGANGELHLLSHGVDTARFAPTPTVPAVELRLLAVGRLVEKKGFGVLLDAVRRLTSPWRLAIVGDGPERAALERRAPGAVAFLGTVSHDDLPALYGSADIVVVPAVVAADGDRDGLPNVVLEAMASGRAVVASDVAAIATAVDDGRTGLLVPPGDPEALAAALARLAAVPTLRAAFGAAARRAVVDRFELGACSERFCDLIEESYVGA